MSKGGYDLDTSGGLMPAIRALVKGPDEDSNASKPKKSQHPYYKRPGKGHNHDCCDACQEGGDLICCDRCPASFHLGCHDPPLEEADIPLGQWLCLECRSAPERPRPPSPTTSHHSATSDNKSRSLRANRSNSCVSSTSNSSRKNDKDKETRDVKEPAERDSAVEVREKTSVREIMAARELEDEKELTPMEVLVRAAKIMNPRQFELPREMQVDCPFPGTDKIEPKGGKPLAYVRDASGCVPLPARVCFHCNVSCRTAPLLQCDYCPLLFHQDCLDPPLTALPVGRWMCPNHVEQFIDWQLVNTISATERIALWQRLAGPVDQDAVRLDFIRRARRARPLFRVRLAGAPPRSRVLVPAMVKHHYRTPPPLQPSLRETLRCQAVLKSNRNFSIYNENESEKKQVICMNIQCSRYLTKNGTCEHTGESDEELNEQEKVAEEDLKAITGNQEETEKASKRKTETPLIETAEENKQFLKLGSKRKKVVKELDESMEKEKEDASFNGKMLKGAAKDEKMDCTEQNDLILGIVGDDEKETREILLSVEEQLKKLDTRLIKLLAFQRLQQIMRNTPDTFTDIDDSIAEMITRNIDRSSLCQYGFKHVALPSELLSRGEVERLSRWTGGAVAPREEVQRLRAAPAIRQMSYATPGCEAPLPATSPMPSLSGMPVRATLCPVERPAKNGLGDGLGRPIPMRLSRLTIGRGACDLPLQRYGACPYVSDKHACIFYDEVTHHFELINYSEFGSRVNGQLYSCDFTERRKTEEEAAGGAEERAAPLRAIAAKRQGKALVDNNHNMSTPELGSCQCVGGGAGQLPLVQGWEGAALLPHATLLQFGCLMFVFSITDNLFTTQ